jgi:hypothetical protein
LDGLDECEPKRIAETVSLAKRMNDADENSPYNTSPSIACSRKSRVSYPAPDIGRGSRYMKLCPSDVEQGKEDQWIESKESRIKSFVLRILNWLFHVKRPLTMAEPLEALSVREYDTDLQEEYFADPRDIIDCCQSLIVCDEATDVVQFTHYTCVLYCFTQADLAKTCVSYLNFEIFGSRLPVALREFMKK